MKLSKYRISAGHYAVGDFIIYRGGSNWWQVRDELDEIVDDFATLREAINYALTNSARR